MSKLYAVYIHITPSNKVYVGLTSQNVKNRWNNGYGYLTNKHFFRSIKKYGWANIQHIIYATGLDEEKAKETEKQLIKKYNSTNIKCGYNITQGGDTRVVTPETRKKISLATKGRPKSEHMRKALSETRKSMIYLPLTEEHKQKISKSLIGNNRAKGCTKNRKIVLQKDINGKTIRKFVSAQEVENLCGYDHSSICRCCRENAQQIKGKYNGMYKGFKWEYAYTEKWANKLVGIK